MEPVEIARRIAQPAAGGPVASIWGSQTKTTADMAAFVNSAMVRCLDMSDSYLVAAVSHPADAFPALVAVAEAEHLDGKALLLATAIAYEAQCRFVKVVPYIKRGWNQTPRALEHGPADRRHAARRSGQDALARRRLAAASRPSWPRTGAQTGRIT